MFRTIYCLTFILYSIFVCVKCLNNCQVKSKCENIVECNESIDICYCLLNDKQLRNGVCLQTINRKCLTYRPCAYGQCITIDNIVVNYTTIKTKSFLTNSLYEYMNAGLKELAYCKCNKNAVNDCNYMTIGKACSHQRECETLVANSECRNGVCSCNQTHYHLDDTCLQKKNFDDFCLQNNECIANLYCRNTQCKCRKNYVFDSDAQLCQHRLSIEGNDISIWDDIAKVSGFVIFGVVMLFLCTKKDSEVQSDSLNSSHRRRSTSSRAHRHRRSSSVNSHRPLTQTSSNASRSSAYRTFEEPVPIRQTIIMPSPAQLIRSLSSSSSDVDYNPYQFDTLFPQQSDNDDPPSYEEVVKAMDSR